jgi:hypothetical protein
MIRPHLDSEVHQCNNFWDLANYIYPLSPIHVEIARFICAPGDEVIVAVTHIIIYYYNDINNWILYYTVKADLSKSLYRVIEIFSIMFI